MLSQLTGKEKQSHSGFQRTLIYITEHLFRGGHSGENSYNSTRSTNSTFQNLLRWYKWSNGKTQQYLSQVQLFPF